MVLPGSWSEESAVPAGMAWGLACLVLGNRLAGRSGQDGLQICCGGFDRPVDARLADRVEKAAVADVTDRAAPVSAGRSGAARSRRQRAVERDIGSLDAGDDLYGAGRGQYGAGRGQDREGPCWVKVSWSSARSSPTGMICWTRVRPGTYRTSSHTPIGCSRSPGCTAALPEARPTSRG